MKLFQKVLGFSATRQARETAVTVNPAYVEASANLFAARIVEFKNKTQMSYFHILPAVEQLSLKLLIKARGIEFARQHCESMLQMLQKGPNGININAFKNSKNPEVPPEQLAAYTELNGLLWKTANELASKGYDLESISQGCFSVMMNAAVKATDRLHAVHIVSACCNELRDGQYD